MVAMRMSKKFNKAVRESKFFQKTALANNPMVRKSLALPDVDDSLKELEHLFDEDEVESNENTGLAKQSTDLNKGAKYT